MQKFSSIIHQLRALHTAKPGSQPSGIGGPLAFAATQSASTVLERLGTSEQGLDPARAEQVAAAAREGAQPEKPGNRTAQRLVRAFVSPFTLILAALAAISFYTNVVLAAPGDKDPSTPIIIAIMVLISGTLRFTQESKSASAARALQALVTTTCTVVRGGIEVEIGLDEVVPGDIVRLSAGDLVPADARILAAKDLFVTQSALTGESEPVEKTAAPIAAAEDANPSAGPALADCTDIVFSGTTIQSGSATAVAVLTGPDTYLGRVARALEAPAPKTSFDRGIESVSRVLVVFMLVMCPIVFLVNGLTKGDWLSALLFSISVAVGITPQMLPVIVTTCLARGATAMAKRDVIVKDLNAIQNLGAMDVLCTDKTGTLTQDRVVLERHMDVLGREDLRVLRHAYLNSYFQTGLKNLIDLAVIEKWNRAALGRGGENPGPEAAYTKVDEVPFDFERRRMSVAVRDRSGKTQLITKGAAEEVLGVCSYVELGGDVLPLSEELTQMVLERVASLNADGMRVIAVAQKAEEAGMSTLSCDDESDMVLMGYLAFLDPPKESAAGAIEALRGYGVRVKVLTGDNEGVAAAVCRKVGIDPSGMLLGSEVDSLDDAELARRAEDAPLFAKLSPLQKQRVVRVLREQGGHVVGFMGDGINDAAAMRASDCGISVDSAVDIAKESAGIILLKKDLMVLEHGILEGRRTYGNTIKYIKATASSNFGNVLSVMVASAFLPFLPMTALQLLLLGAAYTISCAALPWDRVDDEFLRAPKRWEASGIVSFMLWMGPVSSIFDIATFAAMFFLVCPAVVGGEWSALAAAGAGGAMAVFTAVFQSGWFVESMWTQTFVLHMLRTEHVPFVGSRPAPVLTALTFAGVALVTALPYVPVVGPALGLRPLPGSFYLLLVACMTCYLLLCSLVKAAYVRRYGHLL